LVPAVFRGRRPARVAATGIGLLSLALALTGGAGLNPFAANSADITVYLVLGIALTAVGRR
jgi:hypothetical protein